MRRLVLALGAFLALALPAGAVNWYAGNGKHGVLSLMAPQTENTVRSSINGTVTAGASVIPVVTAASFAGGDLVLIIQMYGVGAGQYEFARLTGKGAFSLNLSGGTQYGYQAAGAQVLKVSEYSQVTVSPGANWTAPAWDGATGGVLAAVVRGSFTMTGGVVDMNGKGFLGPTLDPAGSNGAAGTGAGAGAGGQGNNPSNLSAAGGGGGGGYGVGGTAGANGGWPGGAGGGVNGQGNLGLIHMGSSGGQGTRNGSGGGTIGAGGNGGGVILLIVGGDAAMLGGVLRADGSAGGESSGNSLFSSSGGGSGGAIRIVSTGTVSFSAPPTSLGGIGGVFGTDGGAGGAGRIAVLAVSTPTNFSTPQFDATSADGVTLNDPYSPPLPPGCGHGLGVRQDGSTGFTTITQALNALPVVMSTSTCVIIRDGSTYNEQVSVRGFVNNGSTLKIMADPALGLTPAVVPALGGFALMDIANASVAVSGIRVSPTVAVQYGIYVSSPNVTISSVIVSDSMFMISGAGIAASSWTTISYSSVSLGSAHGVLLSGTGSSISYSSAVIGSVNGYALYVSASSGNVITDSYFNNVRSTAAYLSSGSNMNVISRSTMTGGSQTATFNGASGLVLDGVSTNTIVDSVLAGGRGGDPSQSPGGHGLYISGGSSNTVTRSIMSGGGGGMGANGGNFGGGSGGAAGGANSWGGNGLYLVGTTSNTISQSLLAGGGGGNGAGTADSRGHGLSVYGSSFNAVSQSVLAGGGGGGGAPGASGGTGGSMSSGGSGGNGSGGCCDGAPGSHGLFIAGGSGWNVFVSDFLFGGGGGGAGSTALAGAGGNGLYIGSSTGNVITGSFLSAGGGGGGSTGGTGASAAGGGSGGGGGIRPGANGGAGANLYASQINVIDSSSMTGGGFGTGSTNGLAGTGLYVYQSSGNAVSRSYMTSPAASAAQLDFSSDFNTISFSTIAANTSGVYALQFNMAKSNTLQSVVVLNPSGNGIGFLSLSDSNSIRQSTVVAGQADGYGVYAFNSDAIVVTGSYLQQFSGTALLLDTAADGANISFSTIVSNSSSRPAAVFRGVVSNVLTNSFVYNQSGTGFLMDAGSGFNAIVFSTITVNTSVFPRYAYHGMSSSSNTIQLSYLQGPDAVYLSGSTSTVVDSSVLVATRTTGTALNLSTGNVNLSVTLSTLRGGPFGRSLNVGAGTAGDVVVGSVTMTTSRRALELSAPAPAFALHVDSVTFRGLASGATAILFLSGNYQSTITLANFEDPGIAYDVAGAALDPASRVVMRAHYGPRTGAGYEVDPNNVVHWQAGPYPGCVETRNVGLGQDYPTINAGVAALPSSLAGHSCVVVRDTMTYTEQVTVEGFANNGSSITIMADPSFVSSGPLVNATGTAAFIVKNASVNISGFAVRAFAGVQYGILASSANVRISSVSVYDTMGFLNTAGVSLSSYSSLSYSSISVMNAYALLLQGSTMTTVSYSTAANNSPTWPALFLYGASSNTLTGVVATNSGTGGAGAQIFSGGYNAVSQSSFSSVNGAGLLLDFSSFNAITSGYMASANHYGVRLDNAHYNSISQSTISSNLAGKPALYLTGSSSNAISGVFVSNPLGDGASLASGSNNNTLSQSTVTNNSAAGVALSINASSSDTVTGSYLSNTAGTAANLANASSCTISGSTMTGSGAGYSALYLLGSASNTVTQSFMANPAGYGAWLDFNANGNTISLSTMTSNSAAVIGLWLSGASSNTISRSYIGNAAGDAAYLDAGSNYNAISGSTMASNSPNRAFYVNNSDFNTVAGSRASNPAGYGVLFNTGADNNTISQSTMTSNSSLGYAIDITGSSSNTVTGSWMTNPLGYAAFINNAAGGNTISLSTITSAAAGYSALLLAGSSSDTISGSYIQGSTAAVVNGSTGTMIASSALVAADAAGSALILLGQGPNGVLSVASTTLRGGSAGRGLKLEAGNSGVVSIGSVTFTGSARGLEISTQSTGFSLAVDSITFRGLSVGATAIHFLGGAVTSTFTLANFEDTSVGANVSGAALDPASRISMLAHYGVRTSTPFENDPGRVVHWEAGPYPGCVVTRNVGLGQPYATIMAGLAALPQTLTGHSCVVIRDGATYNEEVRVQGFTNDGSSITIMGDPASSTSMPRVSPPPAAAAAFNIMNSSVNLSGVEVRPSGGGIFYGIAVSSTYVKISSVVVNDFSGSIGTAGISASSWTTIAYASVSVTNSYGIWLQGSERSSVSFSSAVNSNATKPALFLSGASSCSITAVTATNQGFGGEGARVEYGGYNIVSLSSFSSTNNNGTALHLYFSSYNSVSGSYMGASSGYGLRLESANYNSVSQSTAASDSQVFTGAELDSASSNTITGLFAWNRQGHAGVLNGGSNNTVSLSTFNSIGGGYNGLYLFNTSSNTITASYASNPSGTAVSVQSASSNTFTQTTITGNPSSYGLDLGNASYNRFTIDSLTGARFGTSSNNNVVTASTFTRSDPASPALFLESASSTTVSQSRMTNATGYALRINGGGFSNYCSVTQSTITSVSGVAALTVGGVGQSIVSDYVYNAGGYGALFSGANLSTILQSTIANNSAASSALYFGNSSTNTVDASVVSNAAGDGVFIELTSDWNALQRSVVRGGANGLNLQSVSGLSVSLSTVIGGGASGAGVSGTGTQYLGVAGSYVQGSTGVYLSNAQRTSITGSLLAGTNAAGVGSGVWMTGGSQDLSMSLNTVLGGGAAGIAVTGAGGGISLSTNTIVARTAAYGIIASGLNAYTLWIASNTVLPSLSAAATTYGVFLNGLSGGATVQNNAIVFRTPGAAFAGAGAGAYGFYASNSAGLRVDHNRISNPSMAASGNYIGAGISGSPNTMFKFNDLYATGGALGTFNLLRIDGSSGSVVRNNILSSSVTATTNRLIVVDAPSQTAFSSDYNTFFSSNSAYSGVWGAGTVSLLANWITVTGRDANSLSSNPLWAAPALEDFHPLSRGGRWDGAAFALDAVSGSGLDRGDPADAAVDEQTPNGARANQGSYGQTAEASKSVLPCLTTLYVRQAGDGDAVLIQDAINSLANPLPNHACIVIGDAGVYNEQVTVQGFINNGSSITIMADPALASRPTVRQGFVIRNASVNVTGIDVIPAGPAAVGYGILASSANVIITSVTVSDPGSFITTAGVALSSFSAMSYSSISVQGVHGLRLDGAGASVFNSTMSNAGAANALYFNGADSNTVTGAFISNPGGIGVYLLAGADYNTIGQSTMVSGGAGSAGVYMSGSNDNALTGSYISGLSGSGVVIDGGSVRNTISLSTMVSASAGGKALYLNSSSSNAATASYFSNGGGIAVHFDFADYNTVSLSSVASGANGVAAVDMTGAKFNRVTGSYLSNPAGYGARLAGASNGNTITMSTLTTNSISSFPLYITGSSSNDVTGSLMSNPIGVSAAIEYGGYNRISGSTITSAAPLSRALSLFGSVYNTVTRTFVSNTGEAVRVQGGSDHNTISYSTMTGDGDASALIITGASSTTIQGSYIQGSTAAIINGSTGTVVNASVLVATNTTGNALVLDGGSVSLTLSSNTFFAGPQGGGVFLDSGNAGRMVLSTNTLRGGLAAFAALGQQAGTSLWITSNTIIPSISGIFKTYGVRLDGLASGATIQNNGIYYRSRGTSVGSSYASALSVKDSGGLVIAGNRISNPGMVDGWALGVGIDNTAGTMFQYNDVHSTGTAIDSAYHLRLTNSPGTMVRGNVFSSSWTAIGGSTASLYVDAASQPGFVSDYNDFFSSNSFNSIEWGGPPAAGLQFPWTAATGQDGNSLARHPRWKDVSAGVEDFHPLSQAGRWNGAAFVNDGFTSGLLDGADPLDPVGLEAAPNGSRANLGSYGGTAEASRSPERPGAPSIAAVYTSSVAASFALTSTPSNGYIVIASTAGNFSGTVMASTTADNVSTVLAARGLAANTTYYLAIGAVWGEFYSFNTTTAAAATLATPPAAALPPFSGVETSSLTVSWLPNGNPVDVATYSVVLTTGAAYPNAFAGNVALSTLPVGALPTATLMTGLAPNTTYMAFAAAVNWGGVPSSYAPLGSTATLAAEPLTALSTFAAVGFSSFSVIWNANGNPLGRTTYTVTVSTASDFNAFASSVSFSTVPAMGPAASFTSLGANTRYYLRVRALNPNGIPSAYALLGSTETRPVTLQAPAVAGVTAVYASSITATWGLTPLATGYTLVASLTNDPAAVFASSAPAGIGATTATVFTPALSPNTTYFLFVQAVGPGAATAFSAFGATATLAGMPVTAASTFSAVFTASMTVSWLPGGNPVGVTTYTLVLSTGSSYPNAFTGNRTLSTAPAGAAPAASFTGLDDNTAYYLFVSAVNHNGIPGAYSALGGTITLIGAPTTVIFDEISSNTIVASAYAPAPLFSNLNRGLSGTRISLNTVYSPFHGEQWVSTTSLPAARREAAAAVFNGKIYVFGGFNGAALGTVERYDPAAASWAPMPAMTARRAAVAAPAGGRIYVTGGTANGFTSLGINEEFDPATDTWGTAKTAMTTSRDRLSAVSAGGSIYAFAGETDGVSTGVNEKYDPATNAWTSLAAYPVARRQIAAAAAAGAMSQTIIAAGGSGAVASAFAYNSVLNTWTAVPSMPAGLTSGAAASLGGKIYVVGGSPALQSVYEYDPASNAWTTRASMITGRAEMSVVAAAGRIYAIGGTSDGGVTPLSISEMYDPGVSTVFTGLTPNTPAGFQAQARNQAGVGSDESVTIATWTWAALPAAAATPFTVVEADSVTVAWASNGNPGGTEFKARASTAASFGGGAAILASDWGAMNSSSTLTLTPNTTYFFQSKARNGVGGVPGIETAWVALGSTSTLAAVPAAAGVPFSGTQTNGLTVSWLPNGNPLAVTTYTVVLSTEASYPNSNAGNAVLASTRPAGAAPTASFTGLSANTTYFAFAAALNHNGLRSAFTSLGSTATLAVPPALAAPLPSFPAVGISSASVSWLPNGNPVGVTTYSVVLSTGGSFNSFAGNVLLSTTPAGAVPTATAPSGLSPNTTYYGYAAAINWNGAVSAYTALGSTATLAAAPLTALSTFYAVHITSLTVSWSAAGNPLSITTYTVQLSTAADFNAFATSFAFSTAPAAGPSATFTGLSDFTQYYFRVRAVNHSGLATGYADLGSTTTLIAPLDAPALGGFSSVDVTSITAAWGLVAGATGYTLEASLFPADPPVVIAASSTTMSAAANTAAAFSPALSPNTTYFLFVRANGALRSSPYAAYGATSTLSSPPATALSTFTGVGITSFTVSWSANGNALAITTYTVQLSTAADFNAFATSVTFTTAPVFGTSAMLTGLSGNTSYYLRVRSLNHNSVPSVFVNLGSTLTVASPLFPTVMNSQAGDSVWRRANTAQYSVGFLDTSGAHLDKFQVKASTTAAGLGTDIAPWTDVVVGLSPIDQYSTPWALPAPVFDALLEGVTNYVSVKVFNGPPLNNFTIMQDAFFVKKDTTAPVFVNTQAGDAVPRSLPGTAYTVAVQDPSSGLAAFQYSASLTPGSANASVIPWTSVAVVANTTSYSTPWTVNFPALISGVTNYISVRSWDTAGATTTLADAFFVHKDTTGPSVAIVAPLAGSFNSSLATLSGTAASIYGVRGTEVSILDLGSNFYWNPPSAAFNSAAPVMIAAAGGASWTLAPGINWADGGSYRAVARSSTTAGLYSTTYATASFVMDLSRPSVAVLAPVPDSTVAVLPQISGTAADPAPNPSGLSSVEVRLRRNADGLWWNWFTQAWSPTAVSSITAGTTAWSLSPTPQLKASLDDGASYFIAVRGSDNALPSNQGDFFVSGATFTWQDATPPSAVADLAASHGSVPGSIDLRWTAPGDDAGAGIIALGEYRIFYSTDVAAVASTSAAQVVVSTAGVNPGDLQAYTLTGLSPSATYYVRLALDDGDDNWSSFSNEASTTAAPSPLNAITGHVVDVSTQGITAVQVDCWNAADALIGTTFTLADGSGTFSVGSLPPGAYKLRVTWTVNGFSSSLWQDGITMGSTNVDFFLEINYALATLTGTLGSLSASSFGGGLGTASASESFVELYQQGRQVAKASVQPTGRWTIPGLLPGAYSVRAFTGLAYTPFQDVQLTEGEVKVLGFLFNPLPTESVFAFPNPARASTTIRFETALSPLQAGIFIFDLAGNLVKEIPDSQISRAAAPTYRAAWDLNNSMGRPVAPGVYHVMVKVKGGSDDQTAKVIKKLAVVR